MGFVEPAGHLQAASRFVKNAKRFLEQVQRWAGLHGCEYDLDVDGCEVCAATVAVVVRSRSGVKVRHAMTHSLDSSRCVQAVYEILGSKLFSQKKLWMHGSVRKQ